MSNEEAVVPASLIRLKQSDATMAASYRRT